MRIPQLTIPQPMTLELSPGLRLCPTVPDGFSLIVMKQKLALGFLC
jgi:hypothetical protein